MNVTSQVDGKTIFYNSELVSSANNVWRYKITPVESKFKVNLKLRDDPITNKYRGTVYETWLNDVARFFEKVITGPIPEIEITVAFDTGMDNIWGQGGPGDIALNEGEFDVSKLPEIVDDLIITDHHMFPFKSSCKFNADVHKHNEKIDSFYYLAIHEFMHAFGFGALWNGEHIILMKVPRSILTDWMLPDVMKGLPGDLVRLPYLLNNIKAFSDFFNGSIAGTLLGLIDPMIVEFGKMLKYLLNYNLHGRINYIGNHTSTSYPRYTGQNGLQQYRLDVQQNATHIQIYPTITNGNRVENKPLPETGGTELVHWDKTTGIIDKFGRNLNDEIMGSTIEEGVGKLNCWMGTWTLGSLADIGWTVDYTLLNWPLSRFKSV